jgi:hypothetical protein
MLTIVLALLQPCLYFKPYHKKALVVLTCHKGLLRSILFLYYCHSFTDTVVGINAPKPKHVLDFSFITHWLFFNSFSGYMPKISEKYQNINVRHDDIFKTESNKHKCQFIIFKYLPRMSHNKVSSCWKPISSEYYIPIV